MTPQERQTFDAVRLARGWLSVALAASTDVELPAICRSLLIEQYPAGVRLVATDRYVLLRSFIPDVNHEPDNEPSFGEAPAATAVAIDSQGRAAGLLTFLLKQGLAAVKDGNPELHVDLVLGEVEQNTEPTFDGMDREVVVIDYPDHERVALETYGGDFPDWRRLSGGFTARQTKVIGLNPDIVARLAKLGKLHPAGNLLWHFGGAKGAAQVEVTRADPDVRGLVMPVAVLRAVEDAA